MTNLSEIWGAKDEDAVPVNRLDAPTKAMEVKREVIWCLTQAQNFIRTWVGTGNQELIDRACAWLEISESEYHLCMYPEDYNLLRGIDMVRVQNIGRQAHRVHMGHDVTKYVHEAGTIAKQDLGISELSYSKLRDRKYHKFTINELKAHWDDIPSQYRTLSL